MNFQAKLDKIVKKNNSLLCVGLDPVMEKIPAHLHHASNTLFEFNKAIIDATADLACAYKPNSAFYEAWGEDGIRELRMTCDYIRVSYPETVIILDAKRGDIGNTNEGYTKFAFDYLSVDAVTVIPYLGLEALKAFFDYKDKGIIVGAHSSNPGAVEYQELLIDGVPLYIKVAKDVKENWNHNNNCLLFVGATYPEELEKVRKVVGDMWLLVPGVGAQEGALEKTVKFGVNSQKEGIIVNASRSVMYAGGGRDFAEKARTAAQKLQVDINTYRS
jgi:orotidine-5'-phosphate decarboxylase